MVKREKIGWSIFGCHYRLSNPVLAVIMWLTDITGNLIFFLRKRKLKTKPESILIIQLDHIGDMILNSALISSIKQTYPDAKISVLIRSLAKPVAEIIDGVDNIIILHTPWLSREKNDGWTGVLKFCLHYFKSFDLTFEVHGEIRNNFTAWMIGNYRVGIGIRGGGFFLNSTITWNREYNLHICDMQNRMLEAITGEKNKTGSPRVTIPGTAIKAIGSLLEEHLLVSGQYVFIQMSAGWKSREWPLENWKIVIEKLISSGESIVTADLDKSKISAIDPHSKFFNAMNVSLSEYAELVKNAKVVISVDTFCGHIASCFNIPTISIYSGTNLWDEWRPFNDNIEFFQETSCIHHPCGQQDCIFGHTSPCMKKITPDEVFKAFNRMLDRCRKNDLKKSYSEDVTLQK